MLKTYHYAFSSQSGSDALTDVLRSAGLPFERNPSPALDRTYYDSFDWRLYGAGLVLFVDGQGERLRLSLREVSSGLDLVSMDVTDSPRFAADLPRGLVWERVAPLLKERRLLPVVRLKSRREEFRILDDEQKTVMRARVERHRVDAGDRQVRLEDRMEVIPMRGFAEPLQSLIPLLDQSPALRGLSGTVFEEALDAVDRHPLDYRARPHLAMRSDMPVGSAARAIFAHLLEVIEINEDGVRQDLDPGFLHDMRVAVRRTRTLLGDMKRILVAPHFTHYRSEFAWLSSITGPVRDLDVHLGSFARYAEWLDAEEHQSLNVLRASIRSRRTAERRVLLEALASQRYRALKKGWSALLDPRDERWAEGEAATPVGESVAAMVSRRNARFLARGARLGADSSDEDYHALRKQAKKLRYLLELPVGPLSARDARAARKGLKALQRNLGEYQDLSVHMTTLQEHGWSLAAPGEARPEAPRALGLLLERMESRKRAIGGDFAHAFSRFSGGANQKKLRELSGERNQEPRQ